MDSAIHTVYNSFINAPESFSFSGGGRQNIGTLIAISILAIFIRILLVYFTYNKGVPLIFNSLDVKNKFKPIDLYASTLIVIFMMGIIR